MRPVILIPARLASTRLPDKPLALIDGRPMISHVWRRAVQAGVGDVFVACDCEAIAKAVRAEGGTAVLTDSDLPSGSDRIWQALGAIDPEGRYDAIVNVQGDMPTLEPRLIAEALALLDRPGVDIGTLAALITDEREKNDPAVVKIAVAEGGRALYFSRAPIPYGDGPLLHHIGIYAYKRYALEKFVGLPSSPLEKREKLEQLRALEAGMHIGVAVTDAAPLGVDTPEGLAKARQCLEARTERIL